MSTFSPAFLSSLQSTMDTIAKKREEFTSHKSDELNRSGGLHSDLDVQERLGSVERTLLHVLTRLDKLEDITTRKRSTSKSTNSDIDDILAATERMLREVWVELFKQQSTIERYRQENESLKEKLQLKGKDVPPSPTLPQPSLRTPSSSSPNKTAPSPQLTNKVSSKKPPIPSKVKQSPVTKERRSSTPSVSLSNDDNNDDQPVSDEDQDPYPPQRTVLPVEYPAGYNPHRGRRFSVVDESPLNTVIDAPRTVIKKSDQARQRIRTCIMNNILFKSLDDDQLEEMIDEMFEVKLHPDEVIIRQGDDGDNFYVVDSGELYVLYKDVVVATVGPGKSFGEIALMYNCPRTATVKAKTDCTLWGMSRTTFRRSLMVHAIKKRELYESFLNKVPLLETLLPYERSIIADALEPRSFKDGDYIIRQGDKGDAFYILSKGKVVATKGEPPVEVKAYSEGDYFGELALLNDQPRAANVKAVDTVQVLCLSREDFAALMGPCEEILKRNMQLYQQMEASFKRDPNVLTSDLVQEEASYKEGLAILVKEFLHPMRPASESKTIPVNPEEVASLFSNIEMLLNIHNTLSSEISQIQPSTVGKIFSRLAPGLKFYNTYCQNWKTAQAVYEKYKNNDAFQTFLKAPSRAPHDFISLLRAPLGRVNRYLNVLKEIQYTLPQDSDLEKAISLITPLSNDISRTLQ